MKYSQEHKNFLRKNYPNLSQIDLTAAFNKKFKTNKNRNAIASTLKRLGIKSGRTGCFERGNVSWNTGTKGVMKANSGNFKKGHIPPNAKPIGSERIDKDGFIHIKIAEENQYTGAKTKYKHKHVVNWERENGPVPKGSVVFFRDSDKTNCDPENLVLITRAELVRLNQMGYGKMSPEIKPSVLALVQMKCKMWDAIKNNKKETS